MAEINDEAIDRAIEAAEGRISAAESAEVSEPAEEAAVEQPDVQQEEPTKSKSRDDKGRFTKGAKEAPQAEASSAEPEAEQISQDQAVESEEQEAITEEVEPQAEMPIEPPDFWSAADKAAFAKAPKEVQNAIFRYEAQRNEWANRINSESAEARAVKKQLDTVYEPHRLKYQAAGIKNPVELTERLLAWNEVFEKDARAGIIDLMRKNNLTPQDLEDAEANYPQQDPQIAEALSQAQAAKQAAEDLKQQLEAQRNEVLKTSIDQWKQGADLKGQPRKAFAEMYSYQIDQAAGAIAQKHPQWPMLEILSHAYEFVMNEVSKLHGFNGAAKPAEPKGTVNPVKAKIAASSVTGAPHGGIAPQRPRAKTIDEAVDRAFDRAGY